MNLQRSILTSYLWNSFGILSIRMIGLVSTLILVRLLEPEEFGVIAITIIIMGLLNILSEVGIERYLVIQKDASDQVYNACWTMNLGFQLFAMFLIYLSIPTLINYFNEPRLANAITITCLIQSIKLFQNIGLVKFIIQMNFKIQNQINIYSKILATIVTILSAYYFQDYRALLAGNAILALSTTFLSYRYCDYRPHFCFIIPNGLFSFSSKLMIRSFASYTRSKIDVMLVGKIYNSRDVGKYSISQEFAVMPHTQLIEPSVRPMFSAFSSHTDKQEILQKTYKFLSLQFIFVFPIIAGVYWTAEQISFLVLGPKWHNSWPILANLTLLMLPFSLQPILNNLYDYWGKSLTPTIMDLFGIAAIIFIAFQVEPNSIELFSQYRAELAVIVFILLFIMARLFLDFSLVAALLIVVIPSFSTIIMVAFFELVYFNEALEWLAILMNFLIGTVVYAFTTISLLFILRDQHSIWQFTYQLITSRVLSVIARQLPFFR